MSELQYGWQDPKHDWEWQINVCIRIPSHSHLLPSAGLYRCAKCGGYMTGEWKQGYGETASPYCLPDSNTRGQS